MVKRAWTGRWELKAVPLTARDVMRQLNAFADAFKLCCPRCMYIVCQNTVLTEKSAYFAPRRDWNTHKVISHKTWQTSCSKKRREWHLGLHRRRRCNDGEQVGTERPERVLQAEPRAGSRTVSTKKLSQAKQPGELKGVLDTAMKKKWNGRLYIKSNPLNIKLSASLFVGPYTEVKAAFVRTSPTCLY